MQEGSQVPERESGEDRVDNPATSQSPSAPVVQGGAPSTLDMSIAKDRAILRDAMRQWPKRFRAITPEKRDNWVNDLEDVRATAKNIADNGTLPAELRLKAADSVRACVLTSGMLDSMQQKDEHALAAGRLKDQHHLERLAQEERLSSERAKAGQPNVNVAVQVQIVDVPSPPLPDVRRRSITESKE